MNVGEIFEGAHAQYKGHANFRQKRLSADYSLLVFVSFKCQSYQVLMMIVCRDQKQYG